jgi:hypothetical protein
VALGLARIVGAFAASGVLLAALLWRSARHRAPVIELSLLRVRSFSVANAGGFVFTTGFYALLLRALVAAIPQEQRAAVMSAFYVAAYGSLSVPAILARVVVSYISLQATFEIFGSVVAAIGLVVAFEAWRTRPVSRLRLG